MFTFIDMVSLQQLLKLLFSFIWVIGGFYKSGDLDLSLPLPWEIVDKLQENQAFSVLAQSGRANCLSCTNSERHTFDEAFCSHVHVSII